MRDVDDEDTGAGEEDVGEDNTEAETVDEGGMTEAEFGAGVTGVTAEAAGFGDGAAGREALGRDITGCGCCGGRNELVGA